MPTDVDLDNQLRAAMKTLDDQVPSGYFEALPDLTLARLEGTMQHGTQQGTTENQAPVVPPPPTTENTEDSGLHDIRNLAQSTKQRLSSKRITTSPPVSEDDLIASSSAGWKAVALPQPAKMVALPELTELPSKKEVLAKEKAAAKAEKVAAKAAPAEVAAPAAAAPAVEARQPAFSLPSAQKKSKKGVIAIVGLGLAAAAGAAIFVTTQKNGSSSDKAAAPAVAQETARTPVAATAPAMAGAGSAAVSADVQKAQDDVAKAEADAEKMRAELAASNTGAAGGPKPTDVPAKAPPKNVKGHGTGKVDTTPTTKTDETKTTAPDKGKDTKKADGAKNADGSEPDFNDLLKEAGVKEPQQKKPALEKKELTGDDFKKGMSAIAGKAQGCYKGTQGTATVKLTIAPSGQIAKVSIGGQFAKTPEGECVANAVKAASFPAWDGHPQSFTYPILLSE